MGDIVVHGGTVVSGVGPPFQGDVAIEGEHILAIGRGLKGRQMIDASGCYVIPGGVDPHVHLQMSLDGRVSSDDFVAGSTAAACGGTTTFIDFVTPAEGQSMPIALEDRRREADGRSAVDYGLHMTIPTWHAADVTRLTSVPDIIAAGCSTFKLYQAYPGMMLDDVSLLRALMVVGSAGGRAVLHSETGPVLDLLRAQARLECRKEPIWHERTRPAPLEATAVHRAAVLANLAKCPLYVFHVGNEAVAREIHRAQQMGVDITGETCPQYLLLTAEEHLDGPDGQLFVCAPPLRSRADRDAMWRRLAQGLFTAVSTDHCPWTRTEKTQDDFTLIPGGLPSIEARLSLLYAFGVLRGHITLERWVELCCAGPARWMGMSSKGALAPGFDADLVIFDPGTRKQLSVDTLHETAGWTPYEGLDVTGWPRTVFLRGRTIVEDGRYTGQGLDGCFVARRAWQ